MTVAKKLKFFFTEKVYWQPASPVALVVKNSPAKAGDGRDPVRTLGREDSLEEGMVAHSNIFG